MIPHRGMTACRSPDGEGGVFGDVPPHKGGQHSRLDLQHSSVGHLVTEHRVRYHGCLSLLVSLEEPLATVLRQLAALAPNQEILWGQDAGVDERQRYGISDDRPEFLHKIERQGRFAVPRRVEKS